jgi:phospholipid transport system substrate-binding protein
MPVSRRAILMSSLPVALALRRALAADAGSGPATVIDRFYDALLSVMKEAKHLSFDQRYQRLAPTVTQTFNLALMSRLSVGPEWAKLQPAQQQHLTDVFSRYTISVYANRFDDFNGERFNVDPSPTADPNGTLVRSSLTKSDGDKVLLNYLLRQGSDGAWQVIDVYLSGTISELATRRSEFAGVIQQRGADGLVQLLEQRTAALRTG